MSSLRYAGQQPFSQPAQRRHHRRGGPALSASIPETLDLPESSVEGELRAARRLAAMGRLVQD